MKEASSRSHLLLTMILQSLSASFFSPFHVWVLLVKRATLQPSISIVVEVLLHCPAGPLLSDRIWRGSLERGLNKGKGPLRNLLLYFIKSSHCDTSRWYYLCFIDEETGLERTGDFLEVTQLMKSMLGIPNPCSFWMTGHVLLLLRMNGDRGRVIEDTYNPANN